MQLTREFCVYCGAGLCEYGANAGENVYVFYGTLDREGRERLRPKGEFFTKYREAWVPEVEGEFGFALLCGLLMCWGWRRVGIVVVVVGS